MDALNAGAAGLCCRQTLQHAGAARHGILCVRLAFSPKSPIHIGANLSSAALRYYQFWVAGDIYSRS
jgi:hypothetical protein